MKVLLADDERTIAITLGDALRAAGHEVVIASDGEQALRALNAEPFDCLITDLRMPKLDGLALMRTVRQKHSDTAVVVITAYGSGEIGFQAAKDGAFDFIQKPFFNEDVILKLDKLEHFRRLQEENRRLKAELADRGAFGRLVGRSPGMQALFEQIRSVAQSDVSVLIEGESGTGKELVARQIHHSGARRAGPFEVVSSAMYEGLIEDDLFGHVKGAFTDAKSDRPGRFERARGGTIFIDDIDDMPLSTQVKLLRVLQEKEVERLGDTHPIRVDVRVIAATKTSAWELVRQKKFRDDLFHRLNVAHLIIPPLRERPDDIPILVQAFIERYGQGREYTLQANVLRALEAYSWPGNVRELEHAVERAIAFAGEDRELKREHLVKPLHPAADAASAGTLTPLRAAVEEAEARHIRRVLDFTGHHKGEAARILGITRKSLWEKMRLYGIESN
ncbi:MAG: sigma-54-dependent Fis family transcriptional regulator [Planctomycetes bacterium]|nr:sigma-54-dependent Fis family transcriptional regulator [Planctomycetota bacterium]